MSIGRSSFTATLLPSGKVLVTGGWNSVGTVLSSAEIYDPATNSWTSAGNMAKARSGHTATLLASGRLLVAGGAADSSAEIYVPAANAWTLAGSMAVPCGGTATLLPNGKVVVIGAYDSNGTSLACTEIYDPTADAWSSAAGMSAPLSGFTATLMPTGKVLVVGGNDPGNGSSPAASSQFFDPALGTWSPGPNLNTGRSSHSATLLQNNVLLVTGGYGGSSTGWTASSEVYW